MFHCSEGGKGHSSVDACVGGCSTILTSNLSGLTIESTMQSGSLSDFLRMAGIFGPDRKRKGFIVPYKVKLRASSSLHHWGRGTASAVEGVRLSLLTEQKLLIGKVGLMGKRAYPDGEAEYLAERRTGTKTGSVFVPRLYPSPPKCGRRFGKPKTGIAVVSCFTAPKGAKDILRSMHAWAAVRRF